MINKEIHLAPLQGLTDVVYRRLFMHYYGGADYCYTPFIRIERGDIRQRDLRELDADELSNLVPQILPANADELNRLTEAIASRGYSRIDINIGCPFPPIAAHGKGCVLFNHPDRIRDILSAATHNTNIEYSLKIRLGFTSCQQWQDVIDDINNTPLRHVTVHARYGKQQYKGECDKEAFSQFVHACRHKVIYNGDLISTTDVENICNQFPEIAGVMIGRGLLADPTLFCQLKGLQVSDTNTFRHFHSELVSAHINHMSGDKQVLGKMKPYWEYLFPNAPKRLHKNIQKANKIDLYTSAVAALLYAVDNPEEF